MEINGHNRNIMKLGLTALLVIVIANVEACPINPNTLPSALNCIQAIGCSTTAQGTQNMLVQNCNTSWHSGSSNSSFLKKLTSHGGGYNTISPFISNNLKATDMKLGSSYALINFNQSSLFYYTLGTSSYSNKITTNCTYVDYKGI